MTAEYQSVLPVDYHSRQKTDPNLHSPSMPVLQQVLQLEPSLRPSTPQACSETNSLNKGKSSYTPLVKSALDTSSSKQRSQQRRPNRNHGKLHTDQNHQQSINTRRYHGHCQAELSKTWTRVTVIGASNMRELSNYIQTRDVNAMTYVISLSFIGILLLLLLCEL